MKIDNAETLAKPEGFWTKPRPFLDQWLALASAIFFMMLLNGGWYTVVLCGVIVLGGLFALTFRFMRPNHEI